MSNGLDRRRVVTGAALALGGLPVLAACGGEAAAPAAAPKGPAGEALVGVADVPVGGGTILSEQQIVVTQPTAGEFKAFSSICTHERCPVSAVSADKGIECTCHFSYFSAEDGSVLEGPAPSPLPAVAVTVEGDQVVRA